MPIADAISIALHSGLEAPVATKAAVRASSAERDARILIGDEEYDRILELAPNSVSDDIDEEYAVLLEAESLLCVAHALPTLNVRVSEKGGLVSEVGFEHTRAVLLSSNQVKAYQREFRQQAHSLLARFLPVGGFYAV